MENDSPTPTVGPPGAPRDALIGQTLNGKYRIISLIGRGGMGKIYKAEQLTLGRMVAIKLLSIVDKTANLAEFRERFFREASLCARLSHPNIVTIHDYGRVEGASEETLLIVMEYLEGKNLIERLRSRGGSLSPAETTAIVVEIARGMREAHKHGIVHRDLKCSNVMLVPDEDGGTRIKILDFGLVKSLGVEEEEESLTRNGTGFLGSPAYMSPEQIQRGTLVDHRTDIYSLGVILFKCLAGRNPFQGDATQVLVAHLNAPLPALRDIGPAVDVPPQLETFMRRMLEKSPEKRVSSAEEVVRSLREIQHECGWTTRSTVTFDTTSSFSKPSPIMLDHTPTSSGGSIGAFEVMHTPPPVRQRRRFMLIGVGALVAVVGGVGLVLGLQPRSSPPYSTPAPALAPKIATMTTPTPAPAAPTPTEPRTAPAPTVAAVPSSTAKPTPAPTLVAHVAATPKRNPVVAAKPKTSESATAPKATPVVPVPAAAIPAPAPPPAANDAGFLSLDTTPWSNVTEGGHSLGSTPLVKVKLSAGSHTLVLTTQSGTSKTFMVNVKAGQIVSKRLGLE